MPILFLRCAKSLDFQIEELNKTGRKGKIAAMQCLEILETIRKEGFSGKLLHRKRTKNGEARVEKCVKYDLGTGYRLITIRCGDHLFVPFIGTHDKADLWLEHNKPDDIFKKSTLYTTEKITYEQQKYSSDFKTRANASFSDEYEEILLNRIDDTTLRQVFKGLVEQR